MKSCNADLNKCKLLTKSIEGNRLQYLKCIEKCAVIFFKPSTIRKNILKMEIWKKLSLIFGIRKEKEELKTVPIKIYDKRRASLSETINSNNDDFNTDSVTSETRVIGDGFSIPLYSSAEELHRKVNNFISISRKKKTKNKTTITKKQQKNKNK